MHRKLCLFGAFFMLLLSAACGQARGPALRRIPLPASDVCGTLSEATVRTLTDVPTGGFSLHATRFSAAHARCVYGVTNGDLVLDSYHFATDADAIAQMAHLGGVTNSVNNTDSAFGTDQVNAYESDRADNYDVEAVDASGYAARHGSTIVALGLDRPQSDFSPAGIKRLQGTALTLAGAHLVPWPTENLCARVPAAELQTLVTLSPAGVTEENKSSEGNSTCTYSFLPLSSLDANNEPRVVLTASLYINQAEAEAGVRTTLTSRPMLATADANDLILHVDDTKSNLAYALHRGMVGRVYVDSAEPTAAAHPSYAAHLEQAALLAAGARPLPGAALAAIPAAMPETALFSAKRSVLLFLSHYWPGVLALLVVLWLVRSRLRRRDLLVHGLPGQARVDSISDTGVTINNDPMIRLHVTITPQTGAPYQASESKVVSRLQMPASLVGQVLEVRIDPKNPQRFVFL